MIEPFLNCVSLENKQFLGSDDGLKTDANKLVLGIGVALESARSVKLYNYLHYIYYICKIIWIIIYSLKF